MAQVRLAELRRHAGWLAFVTVLVTLLLFVILSGYAPDSPAPRMRRGT